MSSNPGGPGGDGSFWQEQRVCLTDGADLRRTIEWYRRVPDGQKIANQEGR